MANTKKTLIQGRKATVKQYGRRLFLVALVISAAGCSKLIRRGQSPEVPEGFLKYSEDKHTGTRYVGEICGIYGLNYARVHGIGLATGLKGTGSLPRESGQREHLVRELKLQKQYDDVNGLLASQDTELVIMEGKLPPGVREGDTFDLEVVTMSDSDSTSLENGSLLQARLRPMARMGRGIKQGNVVGLAKGKILVNALFETRKDQSNYVHGVVLGGGKALEDRPLGLTIRTEELNQKTSMQIAQAINARFTRSSKAGRDGIAEPKTDRLVEFVVPSNYQHNIGRFASVVNQLAFAEASSDRRKRIDQLDQQLSEPSQAALTCLRLEAIGKEAYPILRRALTHHDLEVRFHAAEALGYCGLTDGLSVLASAAESEAKFRWHAFTCLASIDDAVATEAISKLLHADGAETRYGAFQALRMQAPNEPACQGKWLGGDFFLHRVASDALPMIHFSRQKRPEIVIFGDQQTFKDHFVYVQTGLTIRSNTNQTVSLKTYSTEFGEEQRTCSNRVADVIENLAEMGYGYSDQLKMIREAKDSEMLDSRLAINATPKLERRYETELLNLEDENEEDSGNALTQLFHRSDNDTKDQDEDVDSGTAEPTSDASASPFGKLKQWWNRAE